MSAKEMFRIQASNPILTCQYHPDDDTISEAVERIYRFDTENAILFWAGCCIPLCYKYEVSRLIEPLLSLLDKILGAPRGEEVTIWGLDTFYAKWALSWEGDSLTLTAEWASVSGACLECLRENPTIVMSKVDFVCEWKMLMETVLLGLKKCGYREEQVPTLVALERITRQIPEYGVLYNR